MSKHQCIDPSEIQPGDLVAYLHGEAGEKVKHHVARCPFCAAQVEKMRMVDAQLLSAFYRESCPSAEVLADFAFNRLSATEKLRVAAHVRGCRLCTEEVASVRDLVDEEPPPLLSRLREALALAMTLQPITTPVPAVRGASWQGRFEVDDLIVTLTAQTGTLTGRVRHRGDESDSEEGNAWLVGKTIVDEDVPQSPIDARGRFRFASIAKGTYALLLQINGQDVAVESIQVP